MPENKYCVQNAYVSFRKFKSWYRSMAKKKYLSPSVEKVCQLALAEVTARCFWKRKKTWKIICDKYNLAYLLDSPPEEHLFHRKQELKRSDDL